MGFTTVGVSSAPVNNLIMSLPSSRCWRTSVAASAALAGCGSNFWISGGYGDQDGWIGEVNVSDFLTMSPPRGDARPPTWRERRRYIVQLMDSEGTGSSFDRAQFLLGKQLVYFERYGQLFMADTPLLSDPTFYKALLSEAR